MPFQSSWPAEKRATDQRWQRAQGPAWPIPTGTCVGLVWRSPRPQFYKILSQNIAWEKLLGQDSPLSLGLGKSGAFYE